MQTTTVLIDVKEIESAYNDGVNTCLELLRQMHQKDKPRHNYYLHAIRRIEDFLKKEKD